MPRETFQQELDQLTGEERIRQEQAARAVAVGGGKRKYLSFALKGKPVDEITPPEGIVNINGEWFYEEYTAGSGVRELATDPNVPAAATEEEKKSILDLFKR